MSNLFIYDCNGNIVGNPKGYRTFKAAWVQQEKRTSPAHKAIWAAYEERKKTDPKNNLLSRIVPREA
jgi:hypothetical protein